MTAGADAPTPVARPGPHEGTGRAPALLLRGIDKAFDGKPALTDAGFRLEWGEVHALVGENGAGKSTIMNIAAAVYAADAGEVVVDGRDVPLKNPADAIAAGIGMVHQHFRLVGRFSVAENVALSLGGAGRKCSVAEAARLVREKAAEIGFRLDPAARIETLSVAEQQRAEILKVLLLGAGILVLDEPTAVLTEDEAQALLSLVKGLAGQGHAVVLITHKLREVAGYCDRITVMRQGRTVLAEAPIASVTMEEVARHAVGETSPAPVRSAAESAGAEVLALKGLSIARAGGGLAVDGLSLNLRAGEILGIAGVGGNGQSELVACLNGLLSVAGGQLDINGVDMTRASIAARRAAGLRVIPADRFDSAMARGLTLAENLAMTEVPTGAYGGAFRLRRGAMRKAAEQAIADREIRGGGPATQAALLSGGNAQKLLLARELAGGARVIVAHSPSRGLDMRAARAVHVALVEAVAQGAACLLVSEELEEVIALSHRITVMNRGALSAPLNAAEATPARLGELMVGHA